MVARHLRLSLCQLTPRKVEEPLPATGLVMMGDRTGGSTGSEAGGSTGSEAGGPTGSEAGGSTGSEAGRSTGSEAGRSTGSEGGGSTGMNWRSASLSGPPSAAGPPESRGHKTFGGGHHLSLLGWHAVGVYQQEIP